MQNYYWQDFGSSLLSGFRHDPVLFSEAVLGVDFTGREYQKELLSLAGPRRIMRWGRRTGATCVLAMGALCTAAMQPHRRVAFLSVTEDRADEFIRSVDRLLSRSLIPPHLAHVNLQADQVRFDNGSEITAYSQGRWNQLVERDPHCLIVTVADWLNDATFEKLEDWLKHHLTADVIAASTVNPGRNSRWGEWAREAALHEKTGERHGWQGTHVPSTRTPMWKEEVEQELMRIMAPEAYRGEILAEFDA